MARGTNDRLIPLTSSSSPCRHAAVAALFFGMAIMSANLWLLDNYLTDDGHGHSH